MVYVRPYTRRNGIPVKGHNRSKGYHRYKYTAKQYERNPGFASYRERHPEEVEKLKKMDQERTEQEKEIQQERKERAAGIGGGRHPARRDVDPKGEYAYERESGGLGPIRVYHKNKEVAALPDYMSFNQVNDYIGKIRK